MCVKDLRWTRWIWAGLRFFHDRTNSGLASRNSTGALPSPYNPTQKHLTPSFLLQDSLNKLHYKYMTSKAAVFPSLKSYLGSIANTGKFALLMFLLVTFVKGVLSIINRRHAHFVIQANPLPEPHLEETTLLYLAWCFLLVFGPVINYISHNPVCSGRIDQQYIQQTHCFALHWL